MEINILSKLRNRLTKQRQCIVILSCLLVGRYAGGFHFFKLRDVNIRNIRCSDRSLCGFLKIGLGLIHRRRRFTGRFVQFVYRWNRIFCGSSQREQRGGNANNSSCRQHKGVGQHRGIQEVLSDLCEFGNHDIGGQCGNITAHRGNKDGDCLYHAGVCRHEVSDILQHLRADLIELLQRRGVIVANGNLEVVVCVLHQRQLALGGCVPLLGLSGQRGILHPRLVGYVQRIRQPSAGLRKRGDHCDHARLGDPQIREDAINILTAAICAIQPDNERIQRIGCVIAPCLSERICRHARNTGPFFQTFARRNGRVDLGDQLRHLRATVLCADTKGGNRRCNTDNVGFRHTGNRTGCGDRL